MRHVLGIDVSFSLSRNQLASLSLSLVISPWLCAALSFIRSMNSSQACFFHSPLRPSSLPQSSHGFFSKRPLSCSSILALLSNTLFLQPQREQRWCLDDNMRPELPGFYFDEEKKKYFAIKGPIPGSKSASSSSSSSSKASEQKPESKPFKVWRYVSTENIGDAALKEFQVDIQTSQGLTTKNILVAGSN